MLMFQGIAGKFEERGRVPVMWLGGRRRFFKARIEGLRGFLKSWFFWLNRNAEAGRSRRETRRVSREAAGAMTNQEKSDVEHRGSLAGNHAFEGDAVEGFAEVGGDGFPGDPHGMAGFSFDGDGALEEGGVDGFDDLTEGDGVGGAGEEVAAGFAAAAVDESGAAKIIEDLDKKISRHGFPLRHFLKPCKTPPVMDLRELSEGPARVFQFL